MSRTDELLSALLAAVQEQLRWLRASVLPDVRVTLERTLTTTQLRQAYELCDGTALSADIARKVGTSPQSLSRWTGGWRDLGIAYEVEGRRVKHLISLGAVGLPLEVDDGTQDGRRS